MYLSNLPSIRTVRNNIILVHVIHFQLISTLLTCSIELHGSGAVLGVDNPGGLGPVPALPHPEEVDPLHLAHQRLALGLQQRRELLEDDLGGEVVGGGGGVLHGGGAGCKLSTRPAHPITYQHNSPRIT